MPGPWIAGRIDQARLAAIADGLVVATAVSLPWSTSATSILLVIWLLVFIPTLNLADLRRELSTAAGGLPVLLVLLGALGMAWANVPLADRLGGLDGFLKLLLLPLLMLRFRRSEKGWHVLIGFLLSCVALLVASVIVWIRPQLSIGGHGAGIPVKNYIIQSIEFTICAAVLFHVAVVRANARRWATSVALFALVFAFLGDIFFVVTSRTALVIIPVLALVYGFRRFGWRGLFGAAAAGLVLAGAVWTTSGYLRERVTGIYWEAERAEANNAKTSAGERIVFWTKSLEFIADAPLIGHGTGTITEMFERAAAGKSGVRGEVSTNPHNQTFAVGIQLGVLGIAVLWAMWIAQLLLFRGTGLAAWIGLVVVVQNIVGSLFNSFIFDFTEGWLYIVGVGVVAGMVLGPDANRNLMGELP